MIFEPTSLPLKSKVIDSLSTFWISFKSLITKLPVSIASDFNFPSELRVLNQNFESEIFPVVGSFKVIA